MDIDEIFVNPIDTLSDPVEMILGEEELPSLSENIRPPYFIMKNIVFDKELEYFLADNGLPVYYTDGNVFKIIGRMLPTLSSVLRAKFLNTELSFVCKTGEELDLAIPDNLISFITIPSDDLMVFLDKKVE